MVLGKASAIKLVAVVVPTPRVDRLARGRDERLPKLPVLNDDEREGAR